MSEEYKKSYNDGYMKLIAGKPVDRQALITSGHCYTYGGLLKKAHEIRDGLPRIKERKLYVIKKKHIADQLIHFLACQGTGYVPVILPNDSRVMRDDALFDECPPAAAVMAVMTSGTTGVPKILYRDYNSWADFFPIQNEIFGIDEQSRMFAQGSLSFTGNLNLYMGQLYAGGTIIAEDEFAPDRWEQIIVENNVNTIYLIPSKLLLLTKIIRKPDPAVRVILSGSQSLGKRDAGSLKQIFPKAEITLYYGASELNYITYVRDRDMTGDRSLIGRPFPGVSVSVRDGELYVSTPYHVLGIDTPYTLHDRGKQEADGSFYFLGRSDDIVNIRGRKISTLKVQNMLEEIEGVEEALVVTLPKTVNSKEYDSDILAAFIKMSETSDNLTDIRRALGKVLLPHEIPKKIIRVGYIPKNTSGKADRKGIVDMWQRGQLL